MTDLRADLIEAMAKAWVAYEGDEWDDINASGMAAVKACVEREFDAILDTLADRADEWETAAVDYEEARYGAPFGGPEPLIAVLRGEPLTSG